MGATGRALPFAAGVALAGAVACCSGDEADPTATGGGIVRLRLNTVSGDIDVLRA